MGSEGKSYRCSFCGHWLPLIEAAQVCPQCEQETWVSTQEPDITKAEFRAMQTGIEQQTGIEHEAPPPISESQRKFNEKYLKREVDKLMEDLDQWGLCDEPPR